MAHASDWQEGRIPRGLNQPLQNTNINTTYSDVSRDLHLQNTASRFVDGTEWTGEVFKEGLNFLKFLSLNFLLLWEILSALTHIGNYSILKTRESKIQGKIQIFSWLQAPGKCRCRNSDPGATVLPKGTCTPFLTPASVACRSHPRKHFHDTQIQRERILKWEWLNLSCVHLK